VAVAEPQEPVLAVPGRGGLRRIVTWSVPLLLGLAGLGWYLLDGRYVSSDNAYLRADVVAIAPRMAGTVAEVAVASDATVSAGELLLRLDDTELQLALARAEAELAAERNIIVSLLAQLEVRRAEQVAARAAHDYRSREAARLAGLADSGVVSRISYDAAIEQAREAADRLAIAAREVARLEAELGSAVTGPIDEHPQLRLRRAAVEQARVQLGYAVILAPRDGQTGRVTVFPGEQVKAGETLLTLVANQRPWLEVNLKETQLERLLAGQRARVQVDAYPGVSWHARVASIGPATGAEFALLPPENASGNWVKVVQRVPIRLEFEVDAPTPELRAGMSARVSIDTGEGNRRIQRWLTR
jgi:membrane fusion protein, multidrug efflux system